MPPSYKTQTYKIDTEIVGGAGTITNSTTVLEGTTKEVKWEVTPVEDHNYVVKYVIVDGVVRTDLLTANSITLTADKDHKVVVVIDDKLPTNIDKDGDGEPDVNVDTDGDGEPDINIDTNGDGKPDINIDKDGDGKVDNETNANGNGNGKKNGTTGSGSLVPNTSDTSNPLVWLVVSLSMLVIIAVIAGFKRKSRNK